MPAGLASSSAGGSGGGAPASFSSLLCRPGGGWGRRAPPPFTFSPYLSPVVRAEAAADVQHYYSIPAPVLGLPAWRLPGRDHFLIVDLIDLVMYAAAGLFLGLLAYPWLRRGERPPLILLVPALAQYCWFIVGNYWEAYRLFVPCFHSLQYLFIAWAVRLKGRVDRGAAPSRRFVWLESLRWAILILLGGACLFY